MIVVSMTTAERHPEYILIRRSDWADRVEAKIDTGQNGRAGLCTRLSDGTSLYQASFIPS